jgi:PAS domain S-box-containing protein
MARRMRELDWSSTDSLRSLPETEFVSAEAKPSAPAVKSHRILVADDNHDMRHYLQRILGARHKVETVNEGKAALRAAKANPPDLILADIMMPRMNGFQLLAALRADSRTQDVPVILLSARAGQEAKASGIEAGAVDYLVKPFHARELLARVGSLLESAQKNRAALNRSEQALLESGERFRAIFNASPIAIAINSLPDGRFIDANDSYLNLIGFDSKEVIGRRPTALGIWVDPDDRRRLMQTVSEKGALNQFDGRLRMKSGEIRNVLIVAELIELGGAKCVLSLVQDITERKKAEEELRRSEAYLAEGQRLSHTASWAWNVSTGEIFWSQELFRIYGLDPKQVKPAYPSVLNYIHVDDRSRVQTTFEQAVRAKRDYELAFRIVRPDGRIRHVNNIAHPVFNRTGMLIEYVGTTIDNTERIRAEEKLRRSEAHLAEAQRIGHIGSFIWNATTGECLWSKEHYRMVGMDADKFKPTRDNTKELTHPEDLPVIEQTLTRAIRERSDYEMEYRIMRPDGVRYHRCIGRPVAKSNGDLQFTGVVVDLTERKQTEQALQEAETELAHVSRMSAMGEMAAAIAHEINQPLGAIVNNSNYCLQWVGKREPEKKKRAALRDIVNDASRASDIITRVRALTKRSSTGFTKLNVRELIDEALTLTKHSLNEHGITVKTKLAEGAPTVHADRVQLQQVLLNLIVNAIDAMTGVPKERRILTISALSRKLDQKAAVLISIADKGVGFVQKTADRMFDAFYTTKARGMGMGLRISRSIIEGCGGQLSARRNKGRGATFSFILPV